MKKIISILFILITSLFLLGWTEAYTMQETSQPTTKPVKVTKLGLFDENVMFSAPSSWYIVIMGTAEAEEYGAKGGVFYVKIKNPGDAFWHIQFGTHVPINANKTYKLSFDAKADNSRDLQVRVIIDQTWEIVEQKTFDLTNEMKKFSWEFTPKKDAHIIVFDMGKISEKSIATTIYLDNVELEEN
jgi:hypothetical protein